MLSIICFLGFMTWNFYITLIYYDSLYVTFLLIEMLLFVTGLIQVLVLCRKTEIQLHMALPVAEIGHEAGLFVRVINHSGIPLVHGKVRVECVNTFTGERKKIEKQTSVCARDSEKLEIPIESSHCGVIEVKVKKAVITDLTGFLRVSKKVRKGTDVVFLPKLIDMDCEVDGALFHFMGESDEYDKKHPGDDPSELFEIRDYREGDRMQRVHWRATAKSDTLMVKEHSRPLSCALVILADIRTNRKGVLANGDSFVTLLLSYSAMLIERECHHIVAWYDAGSGGMVRQVVHGIEDVYVLMNGIMRSQPYTQEVDLEELYKESFRLDAYLKAYTFSTDCVMRERGNVLWDGMDLLKKQEAV